MPLEPAHLVTWQDVDALDVAETRGDRPATVWLFRIDGRRGLHATCSGDFFQVSGKFPHSRARPSPARLVSRQPGPRARLSPWWRQTCVRLVVLHLDLAELAPPTPHLPHRRLGALGQAAGSVALHAMLVVILALVRTTTAPGIDDRQARPTVDEKVRHLVFLAPEVPRMGGGGGGGGNQQPGPIRRAQAVGTDPMTLRVRKSPPAAPVTAPAVPAVGAVPPLPAVVLDAQPLASGIFEQVGLPTTALLSGTSTGPGSGGGVGTGIGTGIGSGRGPGLGPGSGGGTGGGVYRPGGAVSAPRLLKEVKPTYTPHALLNRIQGTVVLEAIVTVDGCASNIRVVQSLDRRGLDQEAIAAVAQWRFEPGRLAGAPVNVLVTILVDFWVR